MKFAASLLVVILGLWPKAFWAEEKLAKPHQPMWREASPTSGETELDRLNRALVQLANHARPAIAQIRVTVQEVKGTQNSTPSSRGTGFLIDPRGYLLTAQHVIDNAKEIEIRLGDLQRVPARVIASDSQIDVALLRIQTEKELPVLSFADSDAVRVGDLAMVFGYPFGRESSMNMGIISRPGRTFPESASFDNIQTDAGAYAGGSGGPLLNRQGNVIGMITMASERGNMGFATPINAIKRVLPRLANGDKIVWGWLGVRMADVSLEQAKSLGLDLPRGVVVNAVLPGHSAARGGIQKQDVILTVNDNDVASPRDVVRMVGGLEAGRTVRLTILRKGKTIQLAFPLGTKPESAKARES